jgi:NADH:ubiquinone oxidoreductase subunit
MRNVWKGLKGLLPQEEAARLVGQDKKGNRFFEVPGEAGLKRRRYVHFHSRRDIDLDPEWLAWLNEKHIP